MVKFGQTLRSEVKPEWREYYLDYEGLKRRLKDLRGAYKDMNQDLTLSQSQSWSARASMSMQRLSRSSSCLNVDIKEDSFSRALDAEVEKVVLFLLYKQGSLATRILEAKKGSRQWWEGEPDNVDDHPEMAMVDQGVSQQETYRQIGRELADLLYFLNLNVTALRKILKKHDKQAREKRLAVHYLSSRAKAKYSFLQQFYHHEGVTSLTGILRNAVMDQELERLGLTRSRANSSSAAERLMRTPSQSDSVFKDIAQAQQQLAVAQSRTIKEYLAGGSDLMLEQGVMETIDEMPSGQQWELDWFSAVINLATTFLYMTNYYIVGPTSTKYAQALGGSAAVSGVIIGMTPIAACVSCGLYSWWTNYSFKRPLLLCSLLLVLGNIMYAMALYFDAFSMVLCGRLLIGLGGARGINRRYIADTCPLQARTFWAAAFVASGALGMSFGPAMAALLSQIDYQAGWLIVNDVTSPGWFMFLAWALLALLTLVFFREPTFRYKPKDDSPDETNGQTSKSPVPSPKKCSSTSLKQGPQQPSYGSAKALPQTTDGDASSGGPAAPPRASSVRTLWSRTGPDAEEGFALIPASELESGVESDDEEGPPLPLPLIMCLLSYFINKLVTEIVVSSAPVLTEYMFNWSITEVSILMAALGLAVLPVNVVVGRLSSQFQDRWLILVLSIASGLGCILVMHFRGVPWGYSQAQYITGSSIVFVMLQAHEGVLMSATSKIIPPSLAKGTFNSGFLATEAGTFGRFCGDVLITALGILSMTSLLQILFSISVVTCVLMVLGLWWCWPWLDV